MARFNVDFTKSNEEIIQEINSILETSKQELPRTFGSLRNDYENLVKTLPIVKSLLEKGDRIPALSEAYNLIQSLEN
jgi:hypothetical protein